MKRIVKKSLITVILVIAVVLLAFLAREYLSNYYVGTQLDNIEDSFLDTRLLVFAPHCDDEVLGSGELISKVIGEGGTVEVVLMTNGDGNKNALEYDKHKLGLKPQDYIDFGYRRQKESISALEKLGVGRDNIIFLGYPDGGLSKLWNDNWGSNEAYTSFFTMASSSPYDNSYTNGVAFCGENVVSDLIKIIEDFHPDYIIAPHPNDAHSDHWATYNFIKYVETLIDFQPQKEWLYVVHQGEWPVPWLNRPLMYLVPPAQLSDISDMRWLALPLDENEEDQKDQLIGEYKSQTALTGAFLYSFVRKNELFAEYPSVKLVKTTDSINPFDNNIAKEVISNPSHYYLRLQLDKSASVNGVYLTISEDGHIYFAIEMGGNIKRFVTYQLGLILFDNQEVSRIKLDIKGGKIIDTSVSGQGIESGGINLTTEKDFLYITIPAKNVDSLRHLFFNVTTFEGSITLDKSAWRMVDISD